MAKKTGMPLTIAGSAVEVTHEVVPIEEVHLNPDNPRIRFQIQRRYGSHEISSTDLLNLIREQPGYDALQKAIRKAGGLHDPVIVQHDGMVVEGNSRATVYKTLHAGSSSDARWKSIQVARLPKDVPQSAIAMLMAAYHIAGKTVWRPYAQADQIYQLHHTYKWRTEQIADETRMSPREVEQYLEAYAYLVNEVLPHAVNGNGNDILESKFHHALEFIKRKNLANLREDPGVRKQLAKLIVEDKIKGAEVRELDKVLKSRKASTALKKGGFKAAKEVLRETDPIAASTIFKKAKALSHSLEQMGQRDIALLKSSAKARAVLIELHDAVRNVGAIAGMKLGGRNA